MRTTYTYAVLEVSDAAYDEIAEKLIAAGYAHVFHNGVMDMHGIALSIGRDASPAPHKQQPVDAENQADQPQGF